MLILQKISAVADSVKNIIPVTSNPSITQRIADFATHFIDTTGYLGVLVLMIMESMVFPVPSEAVMPFAGMLIYTGNMTWFGVIAVSTLGSIIGSLIGYWMGAKGGRPVIEKWGKYLLLDKEELDKTEKWFQKKGELTVFVCRFIPVVRHLISIPAGMGKMNLPRFCIYTIIGAGMWNSILTVAGYYLQDNWTEIMKYSHTIDYFVVAALGLVVLYYVYKLISKRRKTRSQKQATDQ